MPGNLFLAISSESTTFLGSIIFLFNDLSSPFKKPKSKDALCMIIFFPSMKFKKSSAILSNFSCVLKNFSVNP